MAIHNAASCSYADVVAARDLCVAGDTLGIPAGSAYWPQPLWITMGIWVKGAGIGATNIYSDFVGSPTSFSTDDFLLVYDIIHPENNEFFRMSDLSLDFANKSEGIQIRNNSLTPSLRNRIDHCSFAHCRYTHTPESDVFRVFALYGSVYGVCDNCTFHIEQPGYQIFFILGHNFGIPNWTSTTYEFGTGTNFFLEDNVLYTSGIDCIASGAGGRWCVRHNNFEYGAGDYRWLLYWHEAHGNVYDQNRSIQGVEIYNNTYQCLDHPCELMDQRGGKGLYYNNNFLTDPATSVEMAVREEFDDNLAPPAVNPISGQPQYVSDTYAWNNTKNGNKIYTNFPRVTQTLNYGGSIGVVPRANVHFWSEKSTFDGSDGMGSGLKANRPASCTLEGAGYWATDESKLYRWTNTGGGSWSLYYQPYTYPHPLRAESYPGPGDPTVLTTSNAALTHAASSLTLIPSSDYSLTVSAASFRFIADHITVTPIEAMPWDIKLGLLGAEVTLPVLNWPSGSSPEMPKGTTAYIDSVPLADGSMRHNFRTYSPRKWTFEWAQLTEAQVAVFNELAAHDEPLHFQNKWINADWHWVIITACDPVPITATFTTGTPFWKLTLSLEEIL